MSADIPGNNAVAPIDPNPAPGLPPVLPPSGRHIVQMFLVPGFIVAAVVLVLLFFNWLQSGHGDATSIIANLDAANADVRWRAANDLTQRLKRDEELATSPQLSLRLCELLQKRLEEYDQAQKSAKDGSADSRKELDERCKDVQFLVACVGNLMLPTGSELLGKVLNREGDNENKQRVLLRREAVWAMSNLGNNLTRLAELPEARRAAVLGGLQTEAASGTSDRRHWAGIAVEYLQAIQECKQAPTHGVVDALASAAADNGPNSDLFLRELVAHALNFWHGDDREEKLIDATLVKLSRDAGEGQYIQVEEKD